MQIVLTFIISVSFIFLTSFAEAYIGPGMAGGVIAATIGIVVAILAALFGIVYYPIKRYLKRKNKKDKAK